MFSVEKVKKKPKFTKVSEIDYKIIFLENKGSALSDKENERLKSLKEQKLMLGDNIGKTAKVPTALIGLLLIKTMMKMNLLLKQVRREKQSLHQTIQTRTLIQTTPQPLQEARKEILSPLP
jgi:hypothetical protein